MRKEHFSNRIGRLVVEVLGRAAFLSIALMSVILTSCETTRPSSVEPFKGISAVDRELYRVFGYRENGGSVSRRILFTDPSEDKGMTAFLLGGAFLPGTLEVTELVASNHRFESNGFGKGEFVIQVL